MDKKEFSLKESAPFVVLAAAAVIVFVILYDQSGIILQLPSLSSPEGFVFMFFGAILIFLIFREIVMWYWKINRIVKLLEQIEENTRPIVSGGDEK